MFWNRCRENQWEKYLQNQVDSPWCSVFDVCYPETLKGLKLRGIAEVWQHVLLFCQRWAEVVLDHHLKLIDPVSACTCNETRKHTPRVLTNSAFGKLFSGGFFCIRGRDISSFKLSPHCQSWWKAGLVYVARLQSACPCEAEESGFLSESTKQVHLRKWRRDNCSLDQSGPVERDSS